MRGINVKTDLLCFRLILMVEIWQLMFGGYNLSKSNNVFYSSFSPFLLVSGSRGRNVKV